MQINVEECKVGLLREMNEIREVTFKHQDWDILEGKHCYNLLRNCTWNNDKTLGLGYHVNINSGFKELGRGCFSNAFLGSVIIPEGVVKLGRGAFFECEYLRRVEVPETVTDLESRVFQVCKNLESIKILGVKNIGELAFAGCNKLHTLHLGKGLVSLGFDALSRCDYLTYIVVDSNDDADLVRIRSLLPEDQQTKVISQAAYNIQQQVADEYAYLAAGPCFNNTVNVFFPEVISKIIASYLPLYRDFILERINTANQPDRIPNDGSARRNYCHALIRHIGEQIFPIMISINHANFWASLHDGRGDQKHVEANSHELVHHDGSQPDAVSDQKQSTCAMM